MSRNMGRNTTSPDQDFSEWSSLRLQRYFDDLEKYGRGKDRRICDQVSQILSQREGEYEKYEEQQKIWTNAGKNITNMSPDEIKQLEEGSKILKQKYNQETYSLLAEYFKLLGILREISLRSILCLAFGRISQEERSKNETEIKKVVQQIKYQLQSLDKDERAFVKFPEWWDDILREYSE